MAHSNSWLTYLKWWIFLSFFANVYQRVNLNFPMVLLWFSHYQRLSNSVRLPMKCHRWNPDFIDQNQVGVCPFPMAADAGWTHRSRLKCRQWHPQGSVDHTEAASNQSPIWTSKVWLKFFKLDIYIQIHQYIYLHLPIFPTPIWTTAEIPSSTAFLGASSGPIAGTAIGWCMHRCDASKLLHPKEPFLPTPEIIQWVGLPPSTMPVGSED